MRILKPLRIEMSTEKYISRLLLIIFSGILILSALPANAQAKTETSSSLGLFVFLFILLLIALVTVALMVASIRDLTFRNRKDKASKTKHQFPESLENLDGDQIEILLNRKRARRKSSKEAFKLRRYFLLVFTLLSRCI